MSARPWSLAPRLGVLLAAVALLSCGSQPPRPAANLAQIVLRARGLSPLEARGARLFAARCATCHGEVGDGDGQNAYNLDPPPPPLGSSSLTEAARRTLIVGGSSALGRSPLCPPRGRALAANEVDALTAYLGALVRLEAEAPTPAPRTRRSRRGRLRQ